MLAICFDGDSVMQWQHPPLAAIVEPDTADPAAPPCNNHTACCHSQGAMLFVLLPQVCFAMYMPNLVKFFLYSCHISGSLLVDSLIALLSSEIHCASNFCRNFFWTSELQ